MKKKENYNYLAYNKCIFKQYGFYKSNACYYLSKGILDRFNNDPKVNPFIKIFQRVLAQAIYDEKNGRYSSKELKRIFIRTAQFAKNVNPYDPLLLNTFIEPEIYLKLQYLLKDLTGRYWKMNDFLDMMIYWFIYTYDISNINKSSIKLPLMKNKNKKTKLRKEFNKRFSKYYKNIRY